MPRNMIEDYLAQLGTELPGSPSARNAVVCEIRDGLLDAVDYYLARGYTPDDAVAAAVAEIGSPTDLAAEFAPVVTAAHVHRFGVRFLTLGPIIGALWLTSAALDSFIVLTRPTSIAFLVAVAIVVAIATPCGVFATAATGRASRWLTVRASSAATALLVTATGGAAVDVAVLAFVFTVVGTVPIGLAWVAGAAAATASLSRLTFALKGIPQLATIALRAT